MKKISTFLLAVCVAGMATAGDSGQISATINGHATLIRSGGPVFVQFAGNSSLAESVRQDLKRSGFELASVKADAKQFLLIKGTMSVRSSTGKTVTEDISVFADGPRLPIVLPKVDNAAPPQVPPGHETHGESGPLITDTGMSVLAGYPVVSDLGDQGRGYAKKLMAQGIGTDFSKCSQDGCKTVQALSQAATIDVEVTKGGRSEKARVVASMQSDTVTVDLVTARALYLAMAMVKGQQ